MKASRSVLFVGALLGLHLATPASLSAQCTLADLDPSDGASGDDFGAFVALDGDWLLVGAPLADRGGTNRGAAYLYERDGVGGWIERQTLESSDQEDFDQFGFSVAIEDDLILVGALSDDDLGFDSGSVYVFENTAGVWSETQKLLASNGNVGDFFGISVAISNDRLVIGACQRSLFELFSIGQGMVYVFEHSGSAFVEVDSFVASDRDHGDFFGQAVAVDGDRILVGAEGEDQEGLDAGALYVFDLIGATWTERAKVVGDDTAAGDFFGLRVALGVDRIAASAPMADVGGMSDAGAAYIFDTTDGGASWTQTIKLEDPAPDEDDLLGMGFSLEGDLMVIGAPFGGASDAGSLQLLREDNGVFAVVATLEGQLLDDEFGSSAVLDGDAFVVGAQAENLFGAAHEFQHVRAVTALRTAGANPLSFSMDDPRLGTTAVATVDLGGTTMHGLAGLLGFLNGTTLPLAAGPVLLIDPFSPGGELLGGPIQAGPLAQFNLGIPDDPSLCGMAVSLQAVHFGGAPFALSNALDCVLGS